MNTKHENNVTDHTSAVYAKIKAELSLSIGNNAVYQEKQTWQQRDRLYKCDFY